VHLVWTLHRFYWSFNLTANLDVTALFQRCTRSVSFYCMVFGKSIGLCMIQLGISSQLTTYPSPIILPSLEAHTQTCVGCVYSAYFILVCILYAVYMWCIWVTSWGDFPRRGTKEGIIIHIFIKIYQISYLRIIGGHFSNIFTHAQSQLSVE